MSDWKLAGEAIWILLVGYVAGLLAGWVIWAK
jgi:hypothetical protein